LARASISAYKELPIITDWAFGLEGERDDFFLQITTQTLFIIKLLIFLEFSLPAKYILFILSGHLEHLEVAESIVWEKSEDSELLEWVCWLEEGGARSLSWSRLSRGGGHESHNGYQKHNTKLHLKQKFFEGGCSHAYLNPREA